MLKVRSLSPSRQMASVVSAVGRCAIEKALKVPGGIAGKSRIPVVEVNAPPVIKMVGETLADDVVRLGTVARALWLTLYGVSAPVLSGAIPLNAWSKVTGP